MSSRILKTAMRTRTTGFDFDVVTDVPAKPARRRQGGAEEAGAPSKPAPEPKRSVAPHTPASPGANAGPEPQNGGEKRAMAATG
jgi:hypothetical protein